MIQIDFSLEQLHNVLSLICGLDRNYGRKLVFGNGLTKQEIKEKRVLAECYDLIYDRIKQLQQSGKS